MPLFSTPQEYRQQTGSGFSITISGHLVHKIKYFTPIGKQLQNKHGRNLNKKADRERHDLSACITYHGKRLVIIIAKETLWKYRYST
jgi:hypothetical protein